MDNTPRESRSLPDGPAQQRLLLLDVDEIRGHALYEELRRNQGDVLIHKVHSGSEAQQIIQKERVDVVVISCGAGESAGFIAEVRHWAEGRPIVACEAAAGGGSGRHSMLALSVEGGHPDVLHRLMEIIATWKPASSRANGTHPEQVRQPSYEQIRSTLLRVNHDINNPLSIVSGNAQLLLELARALNLEEDFIQPIRDMEEASTRASQLLGRLTDLAAQIKADAPNRSREAVDRKP